MGRVLLALVPKFQVKLSAIEAEAGTQLFNLLKLSCEFLLLTETHTAFFGLIFFLMHSLS